MKTQKAIVHRLTAGFVTTSLIDASGTNHKTLSVYPLYRFPWPFQRILRRSKGKVFQILPERAETPCTWHKDCKNDGVSCPGSEKCHGYFPERQKSILPLKRIGVLKSEFEQPQEILIKDGSSFISIKAKNGEVEIRGGL